MECSKENIFDFVVYKKNVFHDVYYLVDQIYENSLNVMAICDDKIIAYSNEWLSLIKWWYPIHGIYNSISKVYKNVVLNKSNYQVIDDPVVVFITSFSNGTVHGFGGLFYMLIEYKKNFEGKKVLVYKNSLKGILDIIYHVIPKHLIIEIEQNQIYKLNDATFIENLWHGVGNITDFLSQYIIYDDASRKKNTYSNICIIKNNKSCNQTQVGVINYDTAKKYADDNNYKLIEPTDMNEVDLINTLFTCEKACFTWGTTFDKNKSYLSDTCKEIVCLITPDFIPQFNQLKHNIKKNSNITYYSITFEMNIIEILDLA